MVAQALMKTILSIKTITLLTLCLMFTLLTSTANASQLVAEVDRNQVGEKESLNLTIILNERSLLSSPDFSVLDKDFHVTNTSKSSQINSIQGTMTSITTWRLGLIPKRTGQLTIPAISYGNLSTDAIQIKVDATTQQPSFKNRNQAIYVESSIDSASIYVQAQLLYTIKIFFLDEYNLENGNLTEPSLQDAIINKLGEDKKYDKFIDGKRYNVYEKIYAIFPQSSGNFTIPPISFEAIVSESNTRQGFFGSRGRKRVKRRSEEVQLQVKPIPSEFPSSNWLPAPELTLEERWSPERKQFKVGEPITRTLTITARGLPPSMLPNLGLAELDQLKTYPDKPQLLESDSAHYTLSQRIESNAIIPTKEGDVVLPEVSLYWWNTSTDTLERASIPKQRITIEPGESTANNAPNTSQASPELIQAKQQLELELKALTQQLNLWQIATAALVLITLALISAIIYLLRTKRHSTSLEENISTESNTPWRPVALDLKHLLTEIDNNDPEAIKNALIQWADNYFQHGAINSLGDIKQHTQDIDLIKSITRLEMKIYASTTVSNWNAKEIAEAIQNMTTSSAAQNSQSKDLPGLYPI